MCSQSDRTLELQVDDVGDAAVVYVRGEVRLYEVDALRAELEALAALRVRRIVLELSEMTFICSGGLGAIIAAHIECRHHQGRILLVAPRTPVRRLLETTRLVELFPIHPSLAEALDA